MNPEIPGNPTPPSRTLVRVLLALMIFAATFVLVMSVAGAICFYLPRQYYSRVTMGLKNGWSGPLFNPTDNPVQSPNLEASPFQILRSKEILYPVIDQLKLVEGWTAQWASKLPPKEAEDQRIAQQLVCPGNFMAKQEVYGKLLERMQLTPIQGTNMIEIGVYSADRAEAANIANTIAVVYQKVLQDDQMQRANDGLAGLREEVARQRKKSEAAQAKMREIREKEGVSDPNPEETGPIGGPHIEDIRKYSETKADYTNSKKFSEDSERRLAAETVRIKMTGSPVKIWEKAEPSVYPSKPNVPLIMCLAAGAGVFMGFVFSGIFLLCVCLQRKQPVAS